MSPSDNAKVLNVTLPKESLIKVSVRSDDLTGIATINSALVDFEPKEVFSWHFTILVEMDEHGEDGMPSESEEQVLRKFEAEIDPNIRANGNALFLARVINDGLYELVYRVYKPEIADDFMQEIITSETNLRPFDYRIDPDQKWEKADWYIKAVQGN